jgi:hypothetical protein
MLIAAYPRPEVSDSTAEIYQRMLMDLDFDSAKSAVAQLMLSSKWLPAISEIRASAVDARLGPRRTGMEAYGDVVDAIRRVGAYRPSPDFNDPVVSDCVRQMGWRNLCLGDNEASDRSRFVDLYEALAERGRREQLTGQRLPAPPSGFLRLRALELPESSSPKRLGDALGAGLEHSVKLGGVKR